jgi:hypothetical protein
MDRSISARRGDATNVRGEVAGVLCLLAKQDDDDEVIGPAVRSGGDFMWLGESSTAHFGKKNLRP